MWQVSDVVDGKPLTERPDEYDMGLVRQSHEVFDAMLADVPTGRVVTPISVLAYAAHGINAHNKTLNALFPGHLAFEGDRIRKWQRM